MIILNFEKSDFWSDPVRDASPINKPLTCLLKENRRLFILHLTLLALHPWILEIVLNFCARRRAQYFLKSSNAIFLQNTNFLIYITNLIALVCLCYWLPLLKDIMSLQNSFNRAWTKETTSRSSTSQQRRQQAFK